MNLAVHTIFNLRENILFLEEWLSYHKLIGFDRFYLYDNSKCIGTDGRTSSLNKYQIDFAQATTHISNEQLRERLKNIMAQFTNKVVYLFWEPQDDQGNIVYNQSGSIKHYIDNYSDQTEWTAFIDMDEFIYCKTDIKLKIDEIKNNNEADNIVLFQKKFDDRFNNIGKSVISIEGCIDGIDTSCWGPKNICNNAALKANNGKSWDIHHMLSGNVKSFCPEFTEFRFNHYNVNDYQREWMRSFYGTELNHAFVTNCRDISDRADYLRKVLEK